MRALLVFLNALCHVINPSTTQLYSEAYKDYFSSRNIPKIKYNGSI
jgi:hypothetical protein